MHFDASPSSTYRERSLTHIGVGEPPLPDRVKKHRLTAAQFQSRSTLLDLWAQRFLCKVTESITVRFALATNSYVRCVALWNSMRDQPYTLVMSSAIALIMLKRSGRGLPVNQLSAEVGLIC